MIREFQPPDGSAMVKKYYEGSDMHGSILSLLLFAFLLVAYDAQAQSEQKQSTEKTGSISGRVTFGGKPAAGVKVVASKSYYLSENALIVSAKTDQQGYFQLNKLPSDYYHIVPLTPAYVASEQEETGRPGKAISLKEGETIEGFDFALIRGGVITGRITDEDGQPVNGEMVTLFQVDAKGERREVNYLALSGQYNFSADDRGIYRIYGVPPGRYLVCAGEDGGQGGSSVGKSRYHSRTFHLDAQDESKPAIVEVKAGSEAAGIDIAFGHTSKSYTASGRVIDANTGKPVPNAQIGYGDIDESGSSFSSGLTADAKGNFRLEGLLPGTFYVTATLDAASNLYSNVASFKIKDQDITGLEIKLRRGASISGALVVEGASDPEVMAKLSRLKLLAAVSSPDIIQGASNNGRFGAVSSDGGFHIAGLHPGKISLHLSSDSDSKGFFISRVERHGVEYPDGIEIGQGEQVAGARVVLGYASGRIRGQLKIEGGNLPANAKAHISIWRVNGPSSQSYSEIKVDPNGRFMIEGLITGEYKVSAHIFPLFPPSGPTKPIARDASKKVSVINGAESEITLVVELITKDKDQ